MANKRAGEASAGYMLMKPLVDTATSLGVQPIYDIHAHSLIVQSDGRVAGLMARQYGKTVAVRAAWRRARLRQLRLQRRDGRPIRAPHRRPTRRLDRAT